MKLGVIVNLSLLFALTLASGNMNGEYLISNPNFGAKNQFDTDYSNRPNAKYFDVYSPPI